MTPDEHQRERMRLWIDVAAELRSSAKADYLAASLAADKLLSEFDKRFPAPSTAAPVEAAMPTELSELVFLRHKARLWDAVASGRIELRRTVSGIKPKQWWAFYGPCDRKTKLFPTAEEAVEAAIAAGALK